VDIVKVETIIFALKRLFAENEHNRMCVEKVD
jgi:hypothetical protein